MKRLFKYFIVLLSCAWWQILFGRKWRINIPYKDVKHGECYFFHKPFNDRKMVYFFKDFDDVDIMIRERYKIMDGLIVNVDECTKPRK